LEEDEDSARRLHDLPWLVSSQHHGRHTSGQAPLGWAALSIGDSTFVVQRSSPRLKYHSRAASRQIRQVSIAGGAPHSRQIGAAIWCPRQPRLLRTGNATDE
jgi:hypothetical protein